MGFELSYGDIGILFFLTLGPLKAILPFARATRGTEPAFRRAVAWRAVAIATAIALGVALLGPFILPISPPAIVITCGIILFYQALRIIMQTPAAVPGSVDQENSPSPPSLTIAVFPLAIPAIVTAPGIAAIAAIIVLNRHDLVHEAIVVALLLAVMVQGAMSRSQRFAWGTTSAMSSTPPARNTATELTKERNRLAADRTLMAWIRTALSLIGFGFGIGKVYEYLKSVGIHDTVDPIRSTLIFGSSFIGLGMLALIAAVIQHTRILQQLEAPDYAYNAMRPIAVTVAIMLLMIGAFGLVGILL